MALTGDERSKIRFYLGYPALSVNIDPSSFDIESAMDAVDTRPNDLTRIQAANIGLLARLDSAEQSLLEARKRIKASKVGSIALNGREICQLTDEQNRARMDLAQFLGVANRKGVAVGGGSNYVGI